MSNILPSILPLADIALVVEGVDRVDITNPYGRREPQTRFGDCEEQRHRERMVARIVVAFPCSLFAVRINELTATPSIIRSGSVAERHFVTLRCERTKQSPTAIRRAWITTATLPIDPTSYNSGPFTAFDIVAISTSRRFLAQRCRYFDTP